jgi:hypothetical protein
MNIPEQVSWGYILEKKEHAECQSYCIGELLKNRLAKGKPDILV